jgi:hypothetical protein
LKSSFKKEGDIIMTGKKNLIGFSVALVIVLLFTCSSQKNKEKTEEHYRAKLALMEAEKVDSALVEFKQTIKFDPEHV